MKMDILLRKDQVNTKEDNKDVQLLKNKLWKMKDDSRSHDDSKENDDRRKQ